jgi:hypothetical protein
MEAISTCQIILTLQRTTSTCLLFCRAHARLLISHLIRQSTLEPIPNVKLHPRADGTIHPGDLSKYREVFEDNWKTQEGGILYCVAESRKFWNCLISYHGPTKSTGIKEWDDLFHRLESMGHAKRIIPCMVRVSLFLAETHLTRLDSFLDGSRDVWTTTAHSFTTVLLYSPIEQMFSPNDAKHLIPKSRPSSGLPVSV